MTLTNIIDEILLKEGGYVNHPSDRGGATNFGITEAVARQHGFQGDMQNFTRAAAIKIYKIDYWHKPKFDRIGEISMPVAIELTDTGVNMGTNFPIRNLQRWLNVFNKRNPLLNTDGTIGPITLAALDTFIKTRGKDGEKVLVKALNCSQGHRYLELAENRAENEAFVFGWVKNRIHIH